MYRFAFRLSFSAVSCEEDIFWLLTMSNESLVIRDASLHVPRCECDKAGPQPRLLAQVGRPTRMNLEIHVMSEHNISYNRSEVLAVQSIFQV